LKPAAARAIRLGIDLTACRGRRDGMATVGIQLARALCARGDLECVLFCATSAPSGLDRCGLVVASGHTRELVNKLLWLPIAEGRAGLDAVLYPYWPSPPVRLPSAPPALVFVHDLAFRLLPWAVPTSTRLYMSALLPKAVDRAAAVLVPSETTRSDLCAAYPFGGLSERVYVVGEGAVSLPPAAPPAGLEPGFLLAVGTIEPRKNYRGLAAGYRRLRAMMPAAPPLVIAGGVTPAGTDAAESLGREAGVVLLGHADDAMLSALYHDAAALVFPSYYEGFGLPLLEAMSQGLPAVVSNRGSLPEVAGAAALVVDPDDHEGLAVAMRRLLSDAALRVTLAEAGRSRARAYGWQRAAAAVREVLDAVLASR
jgi:glycosyltransferase involved in cell wall biosynthesis